MSMFDFKKALTGYVFICLVSTSKETKFMRIKLKITHDTENSLNPQDRIPHKLF